MLSTAGPSGRETRATSRRRKRDESPQDALPGLPEHVVCHLLGSIEDPIDLARLKAVSHAMRDAVAATGREIPKLDSKTAVWKGCLSTLQHLQRKGRLEKKHLCAYAALGGHLEVLQWARANGCPWDSYTCHCAAENGHLEVLQWAHSNGCPWDAQTTVCAAKGGHLTCLKYARTNGCPWDFDACVSFLCGDKAGHDARVAWCTANGIPVT